MILDQLPPGGQGPSRSCVRSRCRTCTLCVRRRRPGVAAVRRHAHGPCGFEGAASDFVAILGVIALVGMIVRNSVILVHQIEAEIANGRSRWEGDRGDRPPLPADPADRRRGGLRHDPDRATAFWGPMAHAIMGGPAVATVLTLVFLPALYVAWFGIRENNPAAGQARGLCRRPAMRRGGPGHCRAMRPV